MGLDPRELGASGGSDVRRVEAFERFAASEELLAELRWVSSDEADALCRETEARDRIVKEIADVGITLLLLTERIGVDSPAAILSKLTLLREKYPPPTATEKEEASS